MISNANVRRIPLSCAAQPACRALIVDDDALVRARLERLLEAAQFEVQVAANGEEALRLLNGSPIDLVLTDWVMPDMDGLELCRHIRGLAREDYIYVLMLTVRDNIADRISGLAAGADAYVAKGGTFDEVLACAEAGRRITRRNQEFRWKARGLGESTYLDRATEAYTLAYLLTHLPCELSRARLYGHPLAILYCRIDGTAAADAQRREFVSRCRTALRHDDWIARVGLDDFVIILPETPNAGAHKAGPKLGKLFGHGFTVTIAVTTVDPGYPAGSPAQVAALLRDAKRGVFIDAKPAPSPPEPAAVADAGRALH